MKRFFLIILILASFLIIGLLMRKDADIEKHPLNEISNQTFDYNKEKKMEVEPALDLWKFKLSDKYQKLAKTKTIRADFFGKFNIKDIILKQISLFGSDFDLEVVHVKADYKGFFEFDFEKLLLKGNIEIKDIDVLANVVINNNSKNKIPYSIKGNLVFNIYVIDSYVYLDYKDSQIIISNKKNNLTDNQTIAKFNGKYKFRVEGIGDVIKEIRDYYINYLNVPGNLIDTIKEILNLKLYNGFYIYNFTQKMIKDSLDNDLIYEAIRHLFDEKYEFKLVLNLEYTKAKVLIVDKTKQDYNDNIEFFLDGGLSELNTPSQVIIDINKQDFKEISNIIDSVILKDNKE